MNSSKKKEIIEPRNQLNLYGYDNYFHSFKNLHEKNKLPSVILLSGPKGLGKSTFAYHFINFLLSYGEENEYSLKNFKINSDNLTFRLIQNGTHPNFFLLKNISQGENIKIDQTRNLLKYLNKTTYSKGTKIVLLDNAEYLNLNASNALLKSLEEPSENTTFFIIHNDSSKILDTIKSRCTEFNFFFSTLDKKNIFNKIAENYQLDFNDVNLDRFLYFDTPGNFLKYLIILKDSNLDISKDYLSCILFFMELYRSEKNPELLNFITLFIENFYNELSLNNSTNINHYYNNRNKILYLISDMNKFHLNKKDLLFTIDNILKDERR